MTGTASSALFGRGLSFIFCSLYFLFATSSSAQELTAREKIDLRPNVLLGKCPNCQIVDPDNIGRLGKILANPDSQAVRFCLNNNGARDVRCIAAHQDWLHDAAAPVPAASCKKFIDAHTKSKTGVDDKLLNRIAKGADDIPDADLEAFQVACLTTDIPDRLKRVVGVFRYDSQIIGMGTLIDTDRVITARHVMYSLSASTNASRQRLSAAHVTFTLASNPSATVPIDPASLEALPKSITGHEAQQKDTAVIRLTTKVNVSSADLPVSNSNEKIDVRTPLTIASVYEPLITKRAKAAEAQGKPPAAWQGDLVADAQNTCSVLSATDSGCMQHACVTFNGTSGAGVFQRTSISDGPLKLIGVHVGTPDTPSCGYTVQSFLNVAIIPPKASK